MPSPTLSVPSPAPGPEPARRAFDPIVRRRRWPVLLGVGVLLVLVGCSGTTEVERAGRFAFVSPGGLSVLTYPEGERGTIGEISGPDVMSEATIALSDYPDTVIVLNVWGSWCGPCRAEADSLNTAATASKDLPVQFIGINVRDNRDAAADFHRGKQVPYPSIFDPSMRTLLAIQGFPTSSIPSTIILDRQHRVAQIFLRVVNTGELMQAIRPLATENSPAGTPPTDSPSSATSGPTAASDGGAG